MDYQVIVFPSEMPSGEVVMEGDFNYIHSIVHVLGLPWSADALKDITLWLALPPASEQWKNFCVAAGLRQPPYFLKYLKF